MRWETDSITSAVFIETIQGYFPANQQALDLARALVDLKHARIPVEPLDRVILHVAIAAEYLQSIRADALTHLGGEGLGHGGRRRIRKAGILAPRRIEREQAPCLDADCHVGELECDRLVLDELLLERFALARIGGRKHERGLRNTHRLCRNAYAACAQRVQGD